MNLKRYWVMMRVFNGVGGDVLEKIKDAARSGEDFVVLHGVYQDRAHQMVALATEDGLYARADLTDPAPAGGARQSTYTVYLALTDMLPPPEASGSTLVSSDTLG